MEEAVEEIKYIMDSVITDHSVPRNIKKAVSDAKELVEAYSRNPEVKFTSAMYLLDEMLNDINMPVHTRTDLMGLISELERLKEELK